MANPFKQPEDYTENLQAIERQIEELEALQKQKGYQFLHLLQAAKNKKEIEELKNQAARLKNAERRRKAAVVSMIGGAALALIVTISVTIGIVSENRARAPHTSSPETEYHSSTSLKEETEAETVSLTTEETIGIEEDSEEAAENSSSEENITEASSTDTESDTVSSTAADDSSEEDSEVSLTESEEESEELVTEPLTEQTQSFEALTSEIIENPYTEVWAKDLDVRYETDYAHARGYSEIYLGNGEKLTISIVTPVLGLTRDDFIIAYDESMLSAQIDGPREEDGKTVMKIVFTGNTAGRSEAAIVTEYELFEMDEKAEGYSFVINKLNNTDGRIVYVTPTGEKYHFSPDCGGENSYATTLLDAQGLYDPCSKCAY